MTIKDIAKESGYAIGTVSRVLNNNPSVSPAARAKILEVIKRYNYQPNSNAKHLKQQSSDGLALIVKGTQNMLFVDILEKMQAILEERGYVSTVYYIDEEANEVAQAELICAERKPYGIAFLGSNLEYFTPQLAELRVPCLLLTNSAATLNIPNLSSVSVDDVSASSLMIEYLYAQGHRKIGLIGGKPDQSRPSLSRLTGRHRAMCPSAARALCSALACRSRWKSSMPMPGFRCKADIPPWNTCSSTARILRQCLPCRT